MFLETLMIFFATLLAAALVALGAPGGAEIAIAHAATDASPSLQEAAAGRP